MRHQMCQLGVYHWPHVVSCSALLDLSREYCCSVTQNVIHCITHVRKIWLWYIVYIGAIAFINEERTSNKKRAHFTQTFWSIRVLWSYVYDGYCSNLILKVDFEGKGESNPVSELPCNVCTVFVPCRTKILHWCSFPFITILSIL